VVPAEVIVLEKHTRWAPELSRQLQKDGLITRASQDAAGFRKLIVAATAARKDYITVLDPVGWPGECLPLIAWLRDREVRVVIVGTAEIELLEPSLRELGATTVLLPPIAGKEIGNTCRRLLELHPIQSRKLRSY